MIPTEAAGMLFVGGLALGLGIAGLIEENKSARFLLCVGVLHCLLAFVLTGAPR